MKEKSFNPLIFLAAVGAGGISVMPFAFLQYTFFQGKGLIAVKHLLEADLSTGQAVLFSLLGLVMIGFGLLHYFLLGKYLVQFFKWKKTDQYQLVKANPLKNASLLTPFIALGMSLNVGIASVRFFIPPMYNNLQAMMAPALVVWLVLWASLLATEINLLKISFEKSFDVNQISFGWLLHPFALGMITVVGTGFAALAQDPVIAGTAAFATSVTGGMGLFLLLVKMVTIFKSHLQAEGLPDKYFLPSFLVVVPIITLFAISGFRLVHFFEKQMGFHIEWMATFIVLEGFAFQTWYFAFGLSMLWDYFKKDFFKREYYPSLWSFICPFVGYAVLGAFLHKVFIPNPVLYAVILTTMVVAVAFYSYLMVRMLKCSRKLPTDKEYTCAA